MKKPLPMCSVEKIPSGVSGLRTAVTSEASMAINADTRSKIVISARKRYV